jgi:quercetin dioxygenase-like cupin family protein
MAVERADEHPTFDIGGNTVTSFAAPARGASEAALFRIDLPPGGGLPRHHHDHLDVFAVQAGEGAFHLGEEVHELVTDDSVVVPIGAWHHFVAGPNGASIVVTMLANTKLIREDATETVPPWVS